MHFANKTRITCANFELVTGDDDGARDEDCEDEDDDEDEGVEESEGSEGSGAKETADGGYEEEPATTTAGSDGTAAPSEPPTVSGGPDAGETFIPSAATLSTVSLLGALAAAAFAL